MKLALSKYEIKSSDTHCWQRISEVVVLKILQDNFELITPKIEDMLQGKEIKTPNGIFRIILEEN